LQKEIQICLWGAMQVPDFLTESDKVRVHKT